MSSIGCRTERFIVAVVLLASVKVADAQLTRACCLPNGNCAVREPIVCIAQGGVPDSRHATCDNVVCSGACCGPNGNCAFVTPQLCLASSGTFEGFGTLCADVVCGGACCRANGTCLLSNEAACVSPNNFQGLGSACGTVDCKGACCLPDGTCAETNEPGCVQVQSGEFLGLAATCPTSVCTGACCLADKTCIQTGPGSCLQFGGVYQGRESICGDECPVAMPTAFTYQGQLKRAGFPLNGPIDARFSLWLNPTGVDPSSQIGSTLTINAIEIANGLFSVELDFGQDAFNGNARWLEVEVHDHDDAPDTFTTLTPRQPLTPTPYALQTRGIVVTDDGDVGIGTKTPQARIHVKGPGEGLHIEGPFVGPENSAWVGFYDANQTLIGYVGDARGDDSSVYLASDTGDVHLYTNAGAAVTAKNDGRVGIGTSVPQARLDVRGDIKLGASGEFFAPAGEENLRIVRGTVNERGGIIEGSGFDVANPEVGRYIITFTTPFPTPPSVTAMVHFNFETSDAQFIVPVGITGNTCDLRTFDNTLAFGDTPFHFIAVGPR